MNEEKRCSNCAFPNMDRGYFGCAPMDFVPLTPFSTCIKWVAKNQETNPVDEEEIPAELLGVTEVSCIDPAIIDKLIPSDRPKVDIMTFTPTEPQDTDGALMSIIDANAECRQEIDGPKSGASALDLLLGDLNIDDLPPVDAECAPKNTMSTIGDYLPDEATGALDAIAKVLPRLPDMIDEVASMEPEEKEAFIADIKADMRADQDVQIQPLADERVYASAVAPSCEKHPALLTLTYKGCAIAVPAADAVLDINKKFKQFIDKNVVAW